MRRHTYPHVIENGAGERLTFERLVDGTSGPRLEGTTDVDPGAGPPMHVHFLETECFTVEQGRIGYQRLGEPPGFAGPGESVVFEAGVPHKFWNAGTEQLRCSAWIEPVHSAEYLLTELFASARRNGGRPSVFDAAFLMRRYRSEYAFREIPAAVQAIVFPIVAAVGHVLRKYARYADAPEPVRR